MLSNREMQCLGAVYLRTYCNVFGITDNSLIELVAHLMRIVAATELSAWEKEGGNLAVPGRGEPLPEYIVNKVPCGRLSELNELIEQVVEIGIVDLFGADTSQPKEFLKRARHILQANQIPVPVVSLFQVQPRPLLDSWGEPLTAPEYKNFLSRVLTKPN